MYCYINENTQNKFQHKTVTGLFSSLKKENKHFDRYEEKHGQLSPWNKADT